jgi:hypothetical protein
MNFRVLGATPFSVLCSSSSAVRKAKTLSSVFPHRFYSEFSVTNFAANNNNLRNWNKIAVNEF